MKKRFVFVCRMLNDNDNYHAQQMLKFYYFMLDYVNAFMAPIPTLCKVFYIKYARYNVGSLQR